MDADHGGDHGSAPHAGADAEDGGSGGGGDGLGDEMRDNGRGDGEEEQEEEEDDDDEWSDCDEDDDGDSKDDAYSQTDTQSGSEAEASDSSDSAALRTPRRRRSRRHTGNLGLRLTKQKPTVTAIPPKLSSAEPVKHKRLPKLLSVCLLGWDATDAKLTFHVTLVGQAPNLRVSFAGDVDVRGAVPDIPDPRVLEGLCKQLLAGPLAMLNGSDVALPEQRFSSALKWLYGQVDRMRTRTDDLATAAENKHNTLVSKRRKAAAEMIANMDANEAAPRSQSGPSRAELEVRVAADKEEMSLHAQQVTSYQTELMKYRSAKRDFDLLNSVLADTGYRDRAVAACATVEAQTMVGMIQKSSRIAAVMSPEAVAVRYKVASLVFSFLAHERRVCSLTDAEGVVDAVTVTMMSMRLLADKVLHVRGRTDDNAASIRLAQYAINSKVKVQHEHHIIEVKSVFCCCC
jgi:hypothetical protein